MMYHTLLPASSLKRPFNPGRMYPHPAAGRLTVTGDFALVISAQSGAPGAFDSLVVKYRMRIFQLSLRYMHNPADADDIVQETFLKAYRALKKFRGHCAFYSWLHRIAINAAKTAIRLRRRDATLLVPAELSDDGGIDGAHPAQEVDTPERLALTEEITRALSESMEALSSEQRTALVLREFDGLSYRQVAQAMRCPVGTVRSRVFRAREYVDQRVREVFDDGLGRRRAPGAAMASADHAPAAG